MNPGIQDITPRRTRVGTRPKSYHYKTTEQPDNKTGEQQRQIKRENGLGPVEQPLGGQHSG